MCKYNWFLIEFVPSNTLCLPPLFLRLFSQFRRHGRVGWGHVERARVLLLGRGQWLATEVLAAGIVFIGRVLKLLQGGRRNRICTFKWLRQVPAELGGAGWHRV